MSRTWTTRSRRLALYGGAFPVAFAFCLLPVVFKGEPDIGTLLSGAKLLTQVGAHDKAIVDCCKVLERDPGNVQAHLILALARDRNGERMEAVKSYEAVLKQDLTEEQQLSVRVAIADLYFRDRQYDVAVTRCDEILGSGPRSAQALFVRGMAEYRLGFLDRALKSLMSAAELAPDDERIAGAAEQVRGERASCIAP